MSDSVAELWPALLAFETTGADGAMSGVCERFESVFADQAEAA